MPQPLPPKKEVALALLERSRVHVHLDPRKDGVAVPVGFRKQAQLVLEIGLNMPVPIPDLRLDDEGMTCTLSFSRTPFFCAVPWTSVFAMVGDDGRGMVWPEDVPAEIQAQAAHPETQAQVQKPRAVPALKRAPDDVAAAPSDKRDAKRDEAEPAPKKGAKKTSKGSKKQRPMAAVESEPNSPVLVALPQPPVPKGPRAVPNPKKRAPAPTRKPAQGKGKRELPPYLRVVK